MRRRMLWLSVALLASSALVATAQDVRIVRPVETDEVLTNPGTGFMTSSRRFNGDALNEGAGWTEGRPIVHQDWDGDLTNVDHPMTSLAYFRVNWWFVEPAPGEYALATRHRRRARHRGVAGARRWSSACPPTRATRWTCRTGTAAGVGAERSLANPKWRTDPENPLYVESFGGLVRSLGRRYDGHPDLEAVDVSIVGYWGGARGGTS